MASLWKGRQILAEALGRADATHSDSIQSLDRMRKLVKNGTRNVHHKIDSSVKAYETATTHGKAIAEACHTFSGTTNQFGELATLGRALQQLGEYIAQVQELQQTLDTDLVRQVMAPLDGQVKDMQKAKAAKRNFDKARLDYDTASAKLASLKKSKNVNQVKVNQGEQELQQMKQAMEATGQTSAQQLVEANAQAETELIAKCCAYIDIQRSFHERGLRLCTAYNAALVEFRSHVERRQQEVSIDKSRAKNTMIKELHAATTGVRDAYFGMPLPILQQREGVPVPKLLSLSFDYMREKCLDEEGLFRVSCAKQQMVEVVKQIDEGQLPSWGATDADAPLIADIVKHFFRELPEPLLTHKLYAEFLQATNIADEKEKVAEFARLIALLPVENRAVAAELLQFLGDVAAHSARNKMGPANLATIFGPSLLAAPNYSPTNMGEEMALANLALVVLITKHEALFGAREGSPIRTRAAALPRPPSPRPGGTMMTPSKPVPRPPSPRPETLRGGGGGGSAIGAPAGLGSMAVSPGGPGLSPRGGWRTAAPEAKRDGAPPTE